MITRSSAARPAREQADVLGGLPSRAPDQAAHDALEADVDPLGEVAAPGARCRAESRRPARRSPRAAPAPRRSARSASAPRPRRATDPRRVDELGVEHLDRGPLDRRARERALERVLGGVGLEHADDRALDRGALERPHDRLLGRAVDRVVDPGRRGDPLAGAGADPEQARGQRRALRGSSGEAIAGMVRGRRSEPVSRAGSRP